MLGETRTSNEPSKRRFSEIRRWRNLLETKKTYSSPFADSGFMHTTEERGLDYEGSLKTVFKEINVSADAKGYIDPVTRALYASLPIKAIIDWKVEHPEGKDATKHIEGAVDLGLAMYQRKRVKDLARSFKDRLVEGLGEEILHANLSRQNDTLTWQATNSACSQRTAKLLAEEIKGADVLFIPLAHGGVPAGLDTFSFYCNITKSRNSLLYPVRFSKYKQKDKEPKITNQEKEYLQRAAQGRHVVIFDDDTSGHRESTLNQALGAFTNDVFDPNQPLITAVNIK